MIMVVLALLFLQLILTAECTQSCRNKPCSCCKTGECIKSGNKTYCTDCIDGLTGDTCEEPCPVNCVNCSQIFFPSNRTCFSCKNGFYNGRPYGMLQHPVENDCGRPCKNECAVCESYNTCTKCKIHFYMDNTNTCIECPKNCANCSSATNCLSCLPNCKRCDSFVSCQECDHEFYLEENICKSCIENNYTNEACVEELVPVDGTSSSSSQANTGLIVGLVIGSIAVISICIVVVIIVRRRRKKSCYCWYKSSDRTHDQETKSAIHGDENIELLSNEVRRPSETRNLPSAEKLTVLQMKGTFIAIQDKYVSMKICVDKNNVTVEGDPLDIENAFKEIDIQCGEIEHMRYKHSKSRAWLNFFQKEQIVKYVKMKLKQKELLGIWYINGTELTVCSHGKGNSEKFKNTLLESVIEIAARDEKFLFSSEWWGEFLLNIHRKFQDKIDTYTQNQNNLVIICTDDNVKQVTRIVGEFVDGTTDRILCEPVVCEFISKYWTQDDFDEIRENGVLIKTEANRIMLRGYLENVVQCKEKLNIKLHRICSKQHILKKTGMITVLETAVHSGTIRDIENECRCVMKLTPNIDNSPSAMLSDYVAIDSQTLDEDPSTIASRTCFQTRRLKIKIQLIQGDIDNLKADIIVVGKADDLDVQKSSAFYDSLEHGSPHPQSDYSRRYPNGMLNGEAAVIDSADFNKLYLTSLPPWKEASRYGGKVLRNFMRECLRLADKYDKNSIALSIMVTLENLGYPMNIAVSILYAAIVEFDSSYSNTSLKEISIVIDNEDDQNIKTYLRCHFKRHERDTRTNRIFIQDGTILAQPYDKSNYMMVKDGCAIGPIHLKVQIGNLLDYTTDVLVMGIVANTETKGDEHVLEKNRVVIKESTGVKAKYVIHVLSQDTLAGWRSKLVDCLEEADKKSISSVALPVLGSGVGPKTFSADGIGHCLFAVIDDFTGQNPTSRVTDVILVVPDSDAGCIPAIIAALQDRVTAVNSQRGIGKIFKSQLGYEAESRIIKESLVTVHSDSTINLDRCIKAFDDRIGLEFAKKVVYVDKNVINSLKKAQIDSFIDSDIVVDVMFDQQAGQFTIIGPLLNVLAAVKCLLNKMRRYIGEQNNHQSAEELYEQTRWHWLFVTQMASEAVPYDMMTNWIIETAYQFETQTVELQSKDGKIYAIDFQKLVEYPKMDINDYVMVIRKDIIRPGFLKDVMTWYLKSWTIINNNENVKRVALDDGQEYQEVKKHFLGEEKNDNDSRKVDRRPIQVVKIERIQNKTLYEQYQAKKMMMKQQKRRKLWHETADDYIHWIINNGFNRSYCRLHEVTYGQGVYFAADAFNTIKSNIAENRPGVKRYMFLANVLTGELIKGNPSMRALPPVDPARRTITYDSAVDDVNNPTQFVIFHDKQAYPKYLITYTSK